MTELPTVSVVIVSYETAVPIQTCLRSLIDHAPSNVSQIVVVDNGSTDSTVEILATDFPSVDVLTLAENLGFGTACNRGAEMIHTDYVLFLNPDTIIPPGTVEALLAAFHRNPDAGQIGGRTFDEHGALDPSSCWGIPSLWSAATFATGLSAILARNAFFDPESLGRWNRDTERDVGVITGCLLMMPSELFRTLGGFDETYFLYGEDIDLSMRVRKAGLRRLITPDASITHTVGAASNNVVSRSTLVLKGRMTLFRRQFGPVRGLSMRILYLAGIALRAILPQRLPSDGVTRNTPWRKMLLRTFEWWPGYTKR